MNGSQVLQYNEAPHIEPSYRQKGTEIRGLLCRGSTSHAYIKKTIACIPSKFETVLYPQGNTTKKGFGSKGFRFATRLSDNPGPGSYFDSVNSSLQFASESFSKKGFGNGFVSTCSRFRIENYYPYQVPGPGSYKISGTILSGKKSLIQVSEKLHDNKRKVNSFFLQHKGNTEKNKQILNLGPGSYNILQDFSKRNKQNTAVFKSKCARSFINDTNSPGPGQYETDKEALKRGHSQASLNACSANFKQSAGAKRVKVNLYDPFENVESEDKITPGPGQYVDDQYTMYKRSMSGSTLKSSMFMKNEAQDRFGRVKRVANKVVQEQYDGVRAGGREGKRSETAEKVRESSVFRSEVQRNAYVRDSKGPGPAFYKLKSRFTKGTKNINPTKEWI
eukprot:TRINITY_DN4298_c0_g2_i1.p1 TRINITY_DN4298_c0_g2~~TRINITY_DN4298_c0_g2_i1.p1  ORF type:complete len:391 (+),score=56.56 TRINITY_DN4298_c0_g2_i1:57-1229(+)